MSQRKGFEPVRFFCGRPWVAPLSAVPVSNALEDQKPRPERVWSRIPDDVCQRIVELALDEPDVGLIVYRYAVL